METNTEAAIQFPAKCRFCQKELGSLAEAQLHLGDSPKCTAEMVVALMYSACSQMDPPPDRPGVSYDQAVEEIKEDESKSQGQEQNRTERTERTEQ